MIERVLLRKVHTVFLSIGAHFQSTGLLFGSPGKKLTDESHVVESFPDHCVMEMYLRGNGLVEAVACGNKLQPSPEKVIFPTFQALNVVSCC